jgi:hypothetical protein
MNKRIPFHVWLVCAVVVVAGVLLAVYGCSHSVVTESDRAALEANGFAQVTVNDLEYNVFEKYMHLPGGVYRLVVFVDNRPKGRYEIFVKHLGSDREDMLYRKGADGKALRFYDNVPKAMRYANEMIALRESLVCEYDRMGWTHSEGYAVFREMWVKQRMKELQIENGTR